MKPSILSVVALLASGSTCLAQAPNADVSALIEDLRQAEALYKNVDIRIREVYDIGDREPAFEDETTRSVEEVHYVVQDGKFRLDRQGESKPSTSYPLSRVHLFDGEVSRILSQRIVNLADTRRPERDHVRPHTLLVRDLNHGFPLSTLISGEEAVRAHPDSRFSEGMTLKTRLLADEVVGGLLCRQVAVDYVFSETGKRHNGEVFWLAIDRNLIPVRRIAFTDRWSSEIPIAVSNVLRWAEIEDGIWFPVHVKTKRYNSFAVKRTGQKIMHWMREIQVGKVSRSPDYPAAFFSKFDIPSGAIVYELTDGKITRSYRAEAAGISVEGAEAE